MVVVVVRWSLFGDMVFNSCVICTAHIIAATLTIKTEHSINTDKDLESILQYLQREMILFVSLLTPF